MPSSTPPVSLLRSLATALDDLNVGWYVFGAQAVLHWGRPRFTEDLDVTVLAGSVETTQLVARLGENGFELRHEATQAFVEQTRVLPLVYADGGWALDLVLGGPGLEEEFMRRAILREVSPGFRVPVICPEDLIVTKVLAGRAKDFDDARSVVLAQGGTLDRDAVRLTLSMLEEALGVSDLMPVVDRLFAGKP